MSVVLIIVIVVHGLIHLLGFVKGFHLADVDRLTLPVSRISGVFWLLAALLFLSASVLLMLDIRSWWVAAVPALLLSQYLIVRSWSDAKFGTVANLLILVPLVVAVAGALPSGFAHRFRTEAEQRLSRSQDTSVVTMGDLERLPLPVRKYLVYVGAVGKPRVHNVRALFRGSMKMSVDAGWLDISSMQYNWFDDRTRLFYITSSIFGVPFDGLHMYVGNNATMQIRVASMFQVADAKGEKMTRGETVTLFNDMCFIAPPSLIDTSIQWKSLDSLSAEARFTNRGNTITALLSFNEKGELTNFISGDRYLSSDGKTYESYPWSTPVSDYREFDGRKVAWYGEAAWLMPKGEFTYARFHLQEIEYNCRDFKDVR
ncbi:MAG TPA: DUF6544 family protein [Bacteroidota bacterium]|nr:DUF6544 family protein [Bacteroidota bacterium]